MQIRMLIAEDMLKKQFTVKTQEVLHESELFELDEQPYNVFDKWVKAYASEPKVQQFKKMTQQCAMSLIDPNSPQPELNYASDLPAKMTPQKLSAIYAKIWDLQLRIGLQFKANTPELELEKVYKYQEALFEQHRREAYESVM